MDESLQGIAVHIQGFGGPGSVPVLFSQDREDEGLLKLTERLSVANPSLIHPEHETFEVILQGKLPRRTALDPYRLRVNEILGCLFGLLSVAYASDRGEW